MLPKIIGLKLSPFRWALSLLSAEPEQACWGWEVRSLVGRISL